jgi:hypothetical protein
MCQLSGEKERRFSKFVHITLISDTKRDSYLSSSNWMIQFQQKFALTPISFKILSTNFIFVNQDEVSYPIEECVELLLLLLFLALVPTTELE